MDAFLFQKPNIFINKKNKKMFQPKITSNLLVVNNAIMEIVNKKRQFETLAKNNIYSFLNYNEKKYLEAFGIPQANNQ